MAFLFCAAASQPSPKPFHWIFMGVSAARSERNQSRFEERPTPRHLTNNSIKKFEATTSNSPSCFAIPTRSFLNADRRDLLWWTCQKRVRIWLLQQLRLTDLDLLYLYTELYNTISLLSIESRINSMTNVGNCVTSQTRG
jgi:hypothetical protein